MTANWSKSQHTHIFIFDVGRGLCVFLRTPTNQGFLFDVGSKDDFSPSEFLSDNILPHIAAHEGRPLAQTLISHPHRDHISDVGSLTNEAVFGCSLLTCPNEKLDDFERLDWKRVNNQPGSDELVSTYKSLYSKRNPPLQTLKKLGAGVPPEGVEYGIYYVAPSTVSAYYPKDDQEYTNGTSIVMWYRHGSQRILFPGDCTPDMLARIIDGGAGVQKRWSMFDEQGSCAVPEWTEKTGSQPLLKKLLKDGLSILVAPHHGLESGYCERLYELCTPGLVVVSEKRHDGENDGTVDPRYQSEGGAKGQAVTVNGDETEAYSVTTRSGHVLIKFDGSAGDPEVFVEKDAEDLLEHM